MYKIPYQFLEKIKTLYASFSWRKRLMSKLIRAKIRWLTLTQTQFIGITGSAGKTTIKDLCHLILSDSFLVMSTPRSLNTPIIVAETVLATKRKHRFCIVELGAFKPGALDLPLWLVRPQIAVLTTIQKDHYRAFKGRGLDGIAEEKAKLIAAVPKDGTAVLNIDDPRVREIGKQCKGKIVWVGQNQDAMLRLHDVSSKYPEPLTLNIEYKGTKYTVITGLHGTQLATSVLCALGVALAAGVSLEQAILRLRKSVPTEGRMQPVVMEDGVTFIRDDHKAPYWSLSNPLRFLKEASASRKIIVVGSISDFSGDNSMVYKRCAREFREYADLVVFVGHNAPRALRARQDKNDQALQGFLTLKEAADYLRKTLRSGDLVLLKGSNKADHLLRILLDREKPIQCWREKCELDIFCDACLHLYQPVSDNMPLLNEEDLSAFPPIPLTQGGKTLSVIVGLGNPGEEYELTPHNMGYLVLDKIAERFNGIWQDEEEGQACTVDLNVTKIILFKANAYMNHIGEKLRPFLIRKQCPPEQCLLIYDDMDIPFGTLKYKQDGGDAGHRGVHSCLKALSTFSIPRLRCGVGVPGEHVQAKDKVLTDFNKEELQQLPQILDQAVDIIADKIKQLKR